MWRNWQTRMIQVHLPEMAWRFKSSHPHQESTLSENLRRVRPNQLVAVLAVNGERQDSLEQFIGKFLVLFKEWEMTGALKPDKFLMRSLDRLIVGPNQGGPGVRVVSSLKKENRYAEVRPELSEINLPRLGDQYLKRKKLATRKTEVVHKRIFGS